MSERTKEDENEDATQRTHENQDISDINSYYTGVIDKNCNIRMNNDIRYFGGRISSKIVTDRLSIMFDKQRKLQENFGIFEKTKISPVMKQHFIDRMLLAIHEETVEIGRETMSKNKKMPFGWKQQCFMNEDKCKQEIIDLWHFTMNLWLIMGGTDEEFFEMYLKKNNINHTRQENGY